MMNEVSLAISKSCPHCGAMISICTDLVKNGVISSLNIVNIEKNREFMESYKIRTVPWVKIGNYIFEGSLQKEEMEKWIRLASSPEGDQEYISELIRTGKLNKASNFVGEDYTRYSQLIDLMGNIDTPLTIRIGLNALLEEVVAEETFTPYFQDLANLTLNENPSIRADACFLLGLTGKKEARTFLEKALNDSNPSVQEIAQEALDDLEK